MLQLKSELESSAKSQQDFAQLLRTQEGMLGDFSNKRDSARKTVSFFSIHTREAPHPDAMTRTQQQASVEKLWKNVVNQRQHVLKVRLDSPPIRGYRLLILQAVSNRPKPSTKTTPSRSTLFMHRRRCSKVGTLTRCGGQPF